MGVRRVVTGHTPDGKSIIASDTEVDAVPIGALGSSTTFVWGRADMAEFPDDGLVVQNGTRHRWVNRGDTVARMLAVTIGAHNALEGGAPA
jgi:hypothetical protein